MYIPKFLLKTNISIVPLVPVVEFVGSIWIVDARLGRRRVGRWEDWVARLVAVSFTINVTTMLELDFDRRTDPKPNHIQMTDRNWDVNQTWDVREGFLVPWGNGHVENIQKDKDRHEQIGWNCTKTWSSIVQWSVLRVVRGSGLWTRRGSCKELW